MQYLFFYAWLISFSIVSFKFIHVIGIAGFPSILGKMLFYYMYISFHLYLYIHQWVFRFYPYLDCCKEHCNECWSADKFLRFCSQFIWIYMQKWGCLIIWLFLISWGTFAFFFHSDYSFLYSQQQCTGFQFLQNLGNICYIFVCVVFDNHHPNDHVNDIYQVNRKNSPKSITDRDLN